MAYTISSLYKQKSFLVFPHYTSIFFLREPYLRVWGDHEARDGWGVITSAPFLMPPSEELVHLRGEKLEEQGIFLLPCLLPGEGRKICHHDPCQAYQGATQGPSLLWDWAWGHKASSLEGRSYDRVISLLAPNLCLHLPNDVCIDI